MRNEKWKILGFGSPETTRYDAFDASRIMRSNVPGATLRNRVFRLSETAMLMVGF